MSNPAFDAYFSRLPKRQRAAWEQTRLAALSAGKTDAEATVAAWCSIGVASVPNGAGFATPITLLLGAQGRTDYDPDQPRDSDGRWGSGGGGAVAKAPQVARAMSNLKVLSRTANGTVDVSASPDKAKSMAVTSGAEAADLANRNVEAVTNRLYDERHREVHGPEDLRSMVEGIAADVNRGVTKEGVLLRDHDSEKYHYTQVKDLPRTMDAFYHEFDARLKDPNADQIATAAWAAHEINFSGHFFADGCGKTAEATSNWVLMRSGLPLPTHTSRDEAVRAGSEGGAKYEAYLRSKMPRGTQDMYKHGEAYEPDRVKLHEDYTKSAIDGRPTSSAPTVYLTGGGPASGKTTALLNNPTLAIPGADRAAHIDADSAMETLPEYKEQVAAGYQGAAAFGHEEASDISKEATHTALRAGHDVVFDSVGDSGPDKLAAKVAAMRAAGAKKVVASYVMVDPEEAIRRSDARYAAPGPDHGRYVPHDFIRASYRDVSRTFQGAVERKVFDEASLWDNNSHPPKVVAQYTHERGLVIVEKQSWVAFQKMGS